MLSQEDNLLLQSYFSTVLLVELKNNDFLESQYYQQMAFGSPWVKSELKLIGVDNQGTALMVLYAMLVLPRELIFKEFPGKVAELQQFLKEHTRNTTSSYRSDQSEIDFLRHIRNAVSHALISFRPNEAIVFRDFNRKSNEDFQAELPLCHLGQFLQRLQEVHLEYIRKHQGVR